MVIIVNTVIVLDSETGGTIAITNAKKIMKTNGITRVEKIMIFCFIMPSNKPVSYLNILLKTNPKAFFILYIGDG